MNNNASIKHIQCLFETKDDLIRSLLKHRDSIFTDVSINENLMTHLTDFFILKHPHISCVPSVEKLKFIDDTYRLFIENFTMESVDVASYDPIGKGTYSKVYLSENQVDVIKVVKARNDDDVLLNLKNSSVQDFWQYILDVFTYILWITIFRCLKDRLSTSEDGGPGDLINNMCEIRRPFIVVKSKETAFCVGYVIKKYENTLSQMHASNTVTKDIIAEVAILLYRMHSLAQHGITLLHRDVSSGNVMLTGDTVKLIDFGFGLTVVRFSDKSDWRFGYFFDELYDVIVEGHYDVIFFCLFMLNYHTPALVKMGLYHRFKKLIAFNDNFRLIDLAKPKTIWLYPYKARNIDKSTFMREFIGGFIQLENNKSKH
ncbi:putative kinase [Yasminevirus sp. GU-2018]|uniref:Putative kinase n=1 Tax=Yasminevirus sp. GU-2018 TaxID=2420051 RepID=A0A5K0UAE4_9VIRU|nr:putative kinase [Yasminevirus sp. GU-2018]